MTPGRWIGRTIASTAGDLLVCHWVHCLLIGTASNASLWIHELAEQRLSEPFLFCRLFRRNTYLLLVSQAMTGVGPTALDPPCPSTGMSPGEPEKTIPLVTGMIGAASRLHQPTLIDMFLGRRPLHLNLWLPTLSKIP